MAEKQRQPTVVVERGGALTTVQDQGRPGWRAQGVPLGGALDQVALVRANRLVGNPDNASVLEITVQGPRLRFTAETCFIVSGARFALDLDGRSLPPEVVHRAPAHSRLSFKRLQWGCRACLAVAGGFVVPEVLGSRSTCLVGRFGGHEGRRLESGDVLPVGQPRSNPVFYFERPPLSDLGRPIRIMPGPEFHNLDAASADVLENESFRLSSQSNRTGYRLEAPGSMVARPPEIISAPLAPGTIQLPASGTPILAMRDCPTIGGYPRVAAILTEDLVRVAQFKPGDTLRFELLRR